MKNAVSSAQTFKAPVGQTYAALVEALGSAGLLLWLAYRLSVRKT